MVSIMPGMENFAPDRTLTSSGFPVSPSFCPILPSSLASASLIWASTSGGTWLPRSKYRLQTSVEMVKPGGTGKLARDISASPAPLPPSTSFILPSPSASPPPNEYTYFCMNVLLCVSNDFGKIRDGGKLRQQRVQQGEPVLPDLCIRRVDQHFIKK